MLLAQVTMGGEIERVCGRKRSRDSTRKRAWKESKSSSSSVLERIKSE